MQPNFWTAYMGNQPPDQLAKRAAKVVVAAEIPCRQVDSHGFLLSMKRIF